MQAAIIVSRAGGPAIAAAHAALSACYLTRAASAAATPAA